MATYKKTPKRSLKRPLIITVAILLVAAAVIAALELTNTTHLFHKNKTPVATTGSAETKGIVPSQNTGTSSNPTPSSTSSSTTSTSDKQSTNTSILIAPTGTFANVYRAASNEQMGSTCNTTPGATCQITFTNGGSNKSLPTKTADQGGAVYWSWTPESIGLYVGTWHITATAALNGQTKTTNNDPLTLTITQ